ncbi:MAG: hypothetical protein KC978_08860, partial [Candidatus Omnitrophica bacterium]|nr:hypothetical protein [Candidatus Omnitrophota bacterium]
DSVLFGDRKRGFGANGAEEMHMQLGFGLRTDPFQSDGVGGFGLFAGFFHKAEESNKKET